MVARGLALRALLALLALGLGACSGKPRTEEPAPGPVTPGDAAPADALAIHDATGAGAGSGDLQVRVEWPDVPVAARRPPGHTPCGTPRAPLAEPTTTWGIPDALVIVDGSSPPLAAAHITLADCALTPRVVVGSSLAITSAADRPARVILRKRGTRASLAQLIAGDPIPVMLPIAGHTVTVSLEPDAVYTVETDAADPEVAYIAAIAGYITDGSGQITARGLAAGPHAVTAWLPPRAGHSVRTGRGTATVAAGDLAELTVTLAP
ncbi:MAG TPA: hypothetical protein VFT22_43705 [Kofleriaceae bacterium]|nr:hypothetical protein [Kofleriaceae bacterium]